MDCDLTRSDMRLAKIKAASLIGSYGFTRDDYEGLEQELLLALLEAIPHYDPEKAARRTFAEHVVNNRIRNIADRRKSAKRDYRRLAGSLDDPIDNVDDPHLVREETVSEDSVDMLLGKHDMPIVERMDLGVELSCLLDELPENLGQLALYLAGGKSVPEAADALGVTHQAVYKDWLPRLRGMLSDRGIEVYIL